MKHGLTLKFLLKATLACVLLTVVEILFARFTTIHYFSRTDMKMIMAWIVVGIAWLVYLTDLLRQRGKNKEDDPWNRKGNAPEPWEK